MAAVSYFLKCVNIFVMDTVSYFFKCVNIFDGHGFTVQLKYHFRQQIIVQSISLCAMYMQEILRGI